VAKQVVKDIKIEVRSSSGGEWQDISDHVSRVEYDFDINCVSVARLTIQCDPEVLRLSRLPI